VNSDGTWQAVATIAIVDENRDPGESSRLRGGWVQVVDLGETDAQTDAAGTVGSTSAPSPCSGELSFCITSVIHGRFTYDKSTNDRNWGEIEHRALRFLIEQEPRLEKECRTNSACADLKGQRYEVPGFQHITDCDITLVVRRARGEPNTHRAFSD
jgi:hypothetical protein